MLLPPNMSVLVRGVGLTLACSAAVSGLAGAVLGDPMIALNSLGFIGTCAMSSAAVFYSVALERIGLNAARKAANVLVAVLAVSAGAMALVLLILLEHARFRDEASRFGLHSVAGIVVVAVLVAIGTVLQRDR